MLHGESPQECHEVEQEPKLHSAQQALLACVSMASLLQRGEARLQVHYQVRTSQARFSVLGRFLQKREFLDELQRQSVL